MLSIHFGFAHSKFSIDFISFSMTFTASFSISSYKLNNTKKTFIFYKKNVNELSPNIKSRTKHTESKSKRERFNFQNLSIIRYIWFIAKGFMNAWMCSECLIWNVNKIYVEIWVDARLCHPLKIDTGREGEGVEIEYSQPWPVASERRQNMNCRTNHVACVTYEQFATI